MNQDQRGLAPGEQGTRQNGGRLAGGSVRRAREMAEAGIIPRPPREPIPAPVMPQGQSINAKQDGQSRQANPSRRPGPMPAALSAARINQGAIGSAISKPTPMAQWPLVEESSQKKNKTSDDRNTGRGPAPQRPPRPRNVPSLLDSSKIQEYTPSMPYNQQQQARPQQLQPVRYWPEPPESSIPDFPIPQAAPPVPTSQRKGAPAGPPPTQRRGPSSHYSTTTWVSPIPEERESRRNTDSFASSRVIPSSWGSQSPSPEEEIDEEETKWRGDHDEGSGLVREASLGQRHKPTLRTFKSSEGPSSNGQPRNGKNGNGKGGMVAQAVVGAGAAGGAFAAGLGKTKYDMPPLKQVPVPGRTLLLDASSSSSSPLSAEIDFEKPRVPSPSRSETPPIHPRVAQITGGLEQRSWPIGTATPGMSEKIPGTRRPPRLNMDAVKEAELRGSLTSLPDLIKRATRLAANLDRGRTASRLGMLDLLKFEGVSSEKGNSPLDGRPRSGSISDILASFPPPGLATPTGERPPSNSRWPSPFPASPGGSRLVYHQTPPETPTTNRTERRKSPRRRCCGMPLWLFLLLCVILVLLVAAAVVVPVTLIVLPRQNKSQKSETPSPSCSTSATCSNGGISVISGDACRCVCVNGFTGEHCTESGDAGCTTMDTGAATNATIGNSIPRLLTGSSSNYSIPLNSSVLLALFSSNNLSCSSENALVTFNGAAQKRSLIPVNNRLADLILTNPIPSPTEVPHRDLLLARNPQNDPTVTSNGIVFAATSTPPPGASSSAPSSTFSSPPSQSSTPAQPVFNDPQTTDFARIVILFIFQQTGNLTAAVQSQESIQSFFVSAGGSNQTMGMSGSGYGGANLNFTIDFQKFSIGLANGTTVGGRGPSPSATPTAAAGTGPARLLF